MPSSSNNRRQFLQQSVAAAAGLSTLPVLADNQPVRYEALRPAPVQARANRIKFAVVGMNHPHIYGMTEAVLRGGGELVGIYAKEPELVEAYTKQYPQARLAKSEAELLENPQIHLIISSIIPDERAPLGMRVMQAGKDYMADKPGITSLEQLAEVRKVQQQTKRIYSICYSEHFETRSTVRAGELVKAGAIGKVLQTIGMGPHRISLNTRPAWFFDKKRYGGILCDIGAHQCEQFLFFTGSTQGSVVASQVRNANHPQYPNFEDFGDMMLRGNGGTGYVRLDWFTPSGLSTWGDGRLTILGTDGYIELRKYVDVAGRPGGEHLLLVDQKEMRYIDCKDGALPYGTQLVDDILNRTETAMTQAHCFLATELALNAQKQAIVISI
jgi:predicted dehydrogenase